MIRPSQLNRCGARSSTTRPCKRGGGGGCRDGGGRWWWGKGTLCSVIARRIRFLVREKLEVFLLSRIFFAPASFPSWAELREQVSRSESRHRPDEAMYRPNMDKCPPPSLSHENSCCRHRARSHYCPTSLTTRTIFRSPNHSDRKCKDRILYY